MGFALYQTIEQRDGTLILERFAPLRLGGPGGLIAAHVDSLGDDDDGPWVLTSSQLVQAAPDKPLEPEKTLVLFENKEAGEITTLMRVDSIQGQTSLMRTDMLMSLQPLRIEDQGNGVYEATVVANSKLHESLSLSGGWAKNEATWQWQEAPMSIGGVSLGG